ncbi:hypothetical protein ACFFJT_20470 [Dyella flava]|uniref:Type IV secretion protein Rhs n=1 Tax=Dyella flava TaxID=1920170 RepID=A0ABS2K0V7_9GAMM|nr:hypothetical protein [Dyella flava]MBM7124685.1 hypothetical protein [Dyella flava]GLQ49338.1 hypothetical protein GCM10010872_07870 [Dyella flava]
MFTCGNRNCPICYPRAEPAPPERTPERKPEWPYDEQLRLVSCDNKPACNLPYSILLSFGDSLSGATDGEGRTQRIGTERPCSVMAITLTPPPVAREVACCAAQDRDMSWERIYIKSEIHTIATTNETHLGTSVAKVELPDGRKRRLSCGEIAMARTVFGKGVDYEKVWVHHGGWWLFMGKQDPNTAVTPNGEMYYPHAIYQYDFASPEIDPRNRALFMHEMVHVWQYQMDYAVKRHGLTVTSRGESAYAYLLTPDSHLCDFNMEQQGNIMSDYYMICVLQNPAKAFNPGKDPDLLRKVMEPFIASPRDKRHLSR